MKNLSKLQRAVIRQLGFRTMNLARITLEEIVEHGADAGYSGFTYYNDTGKFFRRNRKLIMDLLVDEADDIGMPVVSMVTSFACVREAGIKGIAVERFLLGTYDGEFDAALANALVWYALERVAYDLTQGDT